jgi:hypothetical protein
MFINNNSGASSLRDIGVPTCCSGFATKWYINIDILKVSTFCAR